MIRYIQGDLAQIGEGEIIVDVQGIGYRLLVSAMTLSELPSVGNRIKVHTYFQVREDGAFLYGFLSREELAMFERLIQVNGVGPKAALAILGTLSVSDLKFAILSEDAKSISRSPGIGAKIAQRIIMELKEKVSLSEAFEERIRTPSHESPAGKAVSDAVEGLVSLGYSATEAMKAVNSVADREQADAQTLLKEALKKLY